VRLALAVRAVLLEVAARHDAGGARDA
jgi:hypothetical protein